MERLEYKGVGVRFLAYLIDSIFLSVIFILINMVLLRDPLPIEEMYILLGLYIFVQVAYFTLLEGFSGASLGKRIVKIKVLREDGEPCRFGAALVRNFFRLIDMLPAVYIAAIILILRSSKKQRLGDKIAGTIVVGEKSKSIIFPRKPIGLKRISKDVSYSKYCVSCGMELAGEAVYCPKCGANQPFIEEE